MKKITFNSKPIANLGHASPDAWVNDTPLTEPTKRFTIDVPISLHRRVKSRCALENLVMADVMRDLLEQRFPQAGGEGS